MIKSSQIKGALLEYLVHQLLINCGFIPVIADDLYTFERGGLFFVNGKGAAHDADVLMEPPVQMPFAYPTRIIYECKAYESRAGLPVVRNALGLREDINEFEVVTKDSLLQRKNNRRATYAIEKRNRYTYQVGVACTGGFTRNAVEFAANNKIPLLSLDWFLSPNIIDRFQNIDQEYIDTIDQELILDIYEYLKAKAKDSNTRYLSVATFIQRDTRIGNIIRSFSEVQDSLFIGLIESGDIIFLRARNQQSRRFFESAQSGTGLAAKIHYSQRTLETWELSISSDFPDSQLGTFDFFVPTNIMSLWGEFSLSRSKAIDIKESYFSRIFVFNRSVQTDMPIFIIRLDSEWLGQVAEAERHWDLSY